MKQKNTANQISRITQATTQRTRSLAALGKAQAGKLQTAVEKRLVNAVQLGTDTLLEQLTNPKNAMFLQEQLARVAQLGFTVGFRLDPNAAKLYNFVQWMEDRHGRERVMTLVFSQNLLADGRMLELLASYAAILSSPAAFRGESPEWKNDEIEHFKEQAGDTLLNLLCELAALEYEQPFTSQSTADKVLYFESAPIPEEFQDLAAMATGTRPDAIVMPGQSSDDSTSSRTQRPSRLRKLAKSVVENTQKALGNHTEEIEHKKTGLARFIPGLHDPTFHFLVFSYTFFLETFMLRNLIENLPEILENLAPLARRDEPFDPTDYSDYSDIDTSADDH